MEDGDESREKTVEGLLPKDENGVTQNGPCGNVACAPENAGGSNYCQKSAHASGFNGVRLGVRVAWVNGSPPALPLTAVMRDETTQDFPFYARRKEGSAATADDPWRLGFALGPSPADGAPNYVTRVDAGHADLRLGDRVVAVDKCWHYARHDSAEDFCRLNALLCTAMGWIFIPAYCFAVP